MCYSMPYISSGDLALKILFSKFISDDKEDNMKLKQNEIIYDTLIQILKSISFLHQGLGIAH